MSLSVVHVLAPAPFGGLESVVHTLASGQVESGLDVTVVGVFTEEPRDHPFWSDLRSVAGVRAIPLVLGGRQYLTERREVGRILGMVEADVLHSHGYRPDMLLGPVARSMGVATVTTVHGFTSEGWRNRLYERLQRRAFRRFDAVVAVSHKLATELEAAGVPASSIHTVPNAWTSSAEFLTRAEARASIGLPGEGKVVGWVGRMSSEKAPDVALAALAAVSGVDCGLSFIGDGPMRGELERSARDQGLEGRVRWHGVVPGAARLLRAFDAVAITSWTEGTPIVLLEAMAAGVPVVTTAVGGIPDVVSETEAALVPAGDIEGIARALGLILAGDPTASQRAEAARVRLEKDYAVGPWVRRYDEIYRTCVPG